MPSDFRQNGDNHEQLNIYYTSIIVKTGNKYNKFSKKPIKLPSISLPTRIKKQYFFTKNLRFQKISLPLQSHFGKVHSKQAEIAQLVEHDLAKVGVASSSLVFRSRGSPNCFGDLCFYKEAASARARSSVKISQILTDAKYFVKTIPSLSFQTEIVVIL